MEQTEYEVERYILRYDQKNERPGITLVFRVVGKLEHFLWYPPVESVVYIADMLRNEKPVFWSSERKYLTTSKESVGEEER